MISDNFEFNKKFGQNFISDKNLLNAIVQDAGITSEDEVLEIGAGAGALTQTLCNCAKKVVSYEIDKKLTEHLQELQMQNKNLLVHMIDALKTTIKDIEKDFEGEYKLVANLPYYITSPLIFKFLEETDRCKSLTVMVQKEVAERFGAKPNTKQYGIPTIMISLYGSAKITRIVSRKMFYPAPNVDSAVIRIDKQKKYNIDVVNFKKLLNGAFSMRRKTLVNNLSKSLDVSKECILNCLTKLNLQSTCRAEELYLEQFVELEKLLQLA